jgi:membrane associated rhomboid family serine protease
MDLGNPMSLFSGLLIGLLGTALFIYGKKQERPLVLMVGIGLCLMPMFVASVLVQWLITIAGCGGLAVAARNS